MSKFYSESEILPSAKLAIEESDYRADRYKSIHKAGCRDLRDPEIIDFKGGTVSDLFGELSGYAGAETLLELNRDIKPCALAALEH